MNVAGKPIELGNDQRCLLLPAKPKGLGQSWSIIPLATLDFHDLAQERPVATVEVRGYGCTLRFQAQATCALPRSGHPQIADEPTFGQSDDLFPTAHPRLVVARHILRTFGVEYKTG